MLSRGNSTASNRLRRAKSSSFAQSAHRIAIEPQTIDPLAARQQAVAAASHAFENAQGGQWQTSGPSPAKDKEKRLGRRQSVRFAGPNATDTRDIRITQRVVPSDNVNNDGHRGPVHAPHISDEAQPRQSESYLPTSQEEYAGFRISSLPSSYQKLRKSKSMFNPLNHRPAIRTGGSSQKKSAQANRALQAPSPRLRRSFSFVRDSDNKSTHTDKDTIQDIAVKIARDRFLRQAENQPSEDNSYSVPSGKTEKSQKAFRRTVRTSSTNSYGSGVVSATSPSADRIAKRGFGSKARSISVSLKNRLKRVFSRTADAEAAFPVQQVDAGRLHFGNSISPSSGVDQQYHPVPSPNHDIVRKTLSRESMLIDAAEILDKPSNQGSIRSVRSDDDLSNTRSRATSWTNSTATNTITSNQIKEKKRLSIIQENGGPHQPSSPIRHYGDLGSLFHQPFRSNSVGARAGVDSRRIYSAIQRRIDERKRNAHSSEESESVTEKGAENDGFQPSDTELVSVSSHTVANTSPDIISQDQRLRLRKSAEFASTTVASDGLIPAKGGLIDQCYQQNLIGMPIGLTPQQIAERNESGIPSPKRPLREVKSTFFPSSTRIERSSTSPYRRAMNNSVEEESGTDPAVESYGCIESTGSPLRRITPVSTRIRNMARTESIYSRTSSGDTPKPEKSSLSLATSAGSAEAGTAVVITTRTRKYDQSLSPFRQRSSSSLRSSVDWQQLMASPFASESPGDENRKVLYTSTSKENGLTRVNAQIHGDDVHSGSLVKAHTESPKRPLGIIQGNVVSPRPVLKSENSQPMNDRFPLFEKNGQPAQSKVNERNSPMTSDSYPVTSMRRWSQADYEKCSFGRKGAIAADKRLSAPLESPSSNAAIRRGQLLAVSENMVVDSPSEGQPPLSRQLRGLLELKQKDKFKARNSPERIARLRRMQSTPNSLGADQLTIKALSRESDAVLGNRYHLQEKQNIIIEGQTTPTKDRRSSDDGVISGENLGGGGSAGEVDLHGQLGDGRKLVDIFLSDPRRQMRINEDKKDGTAVDAVFL